MIEALFYGVNILQFHQRYVRRKILYGNGGLMGPFTRLQPAGAVD